MINRNCTAFHIQNKKMIIARLTIKTNITPHEGLK